MIGDPGMASRLPCRWLGRIPSTVCCCLALPALPAGTGREVWTVFSERQLFGAPMSRFAMVKGHIADMALDVDALGRCWSTGRLAQGSGRTAVSSRELHGETLCTDQCPGL